MNIPPLTSSADVDTSPLEGYILFLPFADGSKSEGVRPFLINSTRGVQLIYHRGDNPFENPFFRPFHGSYCRINGRRGDGDVFMVEAIQELPDPNSGGKNAIVKT